MKFLVYSVSFLEEITKHPCNFSENMVENAT